jgi:hypothetical protein
VVRRSFAVRDQAQRLPIHEDRLAVGVVGKARRPGWPTAPNSRGDELVQAPPSSRSVGTRRYSTMPAAEVDEPATHGAGFTFLGRRAASRARDRRCHSKLRATHSGVTSWTDS